MSLTKITYSMIEGAVVNVIDFGADPTGERDSYRAIQDAINSLSSTAYNGTLGGGTVLIPAGRYRITQGLLVSWGIRLLGTGGGGYPYNWGDSKASVLIADFGVNVNQWVIDTATYYKTGPKTGQRIEYNAHLTDQIDSLYNPTHQLAIQNINITTSTLDNIIWGGIRLIGAPQATISQVSLANTGIGLELQTSFLAGVHDWNSQTMYYGLVMWNANNNVRIDGTFDRLTGPETPTLPAGRVLSDILPSAIYCTDLGIDTAHATSDKGIIVAGSFGNIGSNMAELNITAQYWTDAAFHYGTNSSLYKGLYTEADSVRYVLTTAYASVVIESTSVYAQNAASRFFDIGFGSRVDARIDGLASVGGMFRTVNDNINQYNNTSVLLRGQWQDTFNLNRVGVENRGRALAFVGFDGSSLAINNKYNIQTVARSVGETIGDYVVSFHPNYKGGAYDITTLAIPAVTVAANEPVIAQVWWGGGDGLNSYQCRIRCVNLAGDPVNPIRVFLTLHM